MLKLFKKKGSQKTVPPHEDHEEGVKKDIGGKMDTLVGPKKKKFRKIKWPPKKFFFIFFIFALALGASFFVVYTLYIAPEDPKTVKPAYKKIELPHINLPEEMLRFSFDHFPDLYNAMITFNHEITLMDKEITRITAIAQKYPEQAKIAEKEKAVWEKSKDTLQKSFLKIEIPVKEIYVLSRVNSEQAMIQIDERNKELTELAQTALAQAMALTRSRISDEAPPQGLLKGTLYRLKKMIL